MENADWTTTILTGLIPGGQLYSRYKYYNLSFDRLYLIPFTFLPLLNLPISILWKFNKFAPGKGTGVPINPLSGWLFIPILAFTLLPQLLEKVELESSYITAISIIVTMIALMIPGTIFLSSDKCKTEINKSFMSNMGKALSTGITAYGIACLGGIALGYSANDLMSNIIISAFYILSYFIVMIFNQLEPNICNTGIFGSTIDNLSLMAAACIILYRYISNKDS